MLRAACDTGDMPTDVTITDIQRLAASKAAYRELEPRVLAGEPWPLAVDFGTGPEASWGAREVLAHVAEMLPYWLGELERVLDGDGTTPVPFGRMPDDPIRLAMIERERTLPLRVLFARVDAGIDAWITRLASLSDDERARIGLHPRRGAMSVAGMPEVFVTGHLEDHASQLESILEAAGRS
jgi:hypothetical protein